MSKSFSLDLTDLKVVITKAAMVAAVAGLTYLGQNLMHLNLGAASVFVVPVLSAVIDTLIRWAKDNTATK
jgi:hypothetical protein